MPLAQHLADKPRALLVRRVGAHAQVVHRVEYAPLDGLQPVADVRQGARDDDAHRVVEIRAPHLVHNGSGLDVSEFRLRHRLSYHEQLLMSARGRAANLAAPPPCRTDAEGGAEEAPNRFEPRWPSALYRSQPMPRLQPALPRRLHASGAVVVVMFWSGHIPARPSARRKRRRILCIVTFCGVLFHLG